MEQKFCSGGLIFGNKNMYSFLHYKKYTSSKFLEDFENIDGIVEAINGKVRISDVIYSTDFENLFIIPSKLEWLDCLEEMGVSLMDEKMYYRLQELGEFDLKTSSWIDTPADVRDKGGALFCERRYGRVFTFHNGADSYFSVRGWRGYICL